jgi:hypothetical protein
MTPLLPACDTIGKLMLKQEKIVATLSHKMPPWILWLAWMPSVGTPETSEAAMMQGIQTMASQTNMIKSGKIRAPSTPSLKVSTQRKVATGA